MASYSHQSCARWMLSGTLTLLAAILVVQLVAQTAQAQTFVNKFDRAPVNIAGCRLEEKVLNETVDPGSFTVATHGTCTITIIWEDHFSNCTALVNASVNYYPTYWITDVGVIDIQYVLGGTTPIARADLDEDPRLTYWTPDSCSYEYDE